MNRCTLSSPLVLAALLACVPARSAEPTKQQCVDANDVAQDLRRAGKLRDARQKLVMCAAQSCPSIVRQDCEQRLSELDASMPTIIFEAKDAAGTDVASVKVMMDGQPFADSLDGTPLPVDPGSHRFVFSGRGLRTADEVLVTREGDKARHERVVLAPPVQEPSTLSKKDEPVDRTVPGSNGDTQRMIGLVLGGAGAVGVVVGTIFGLVSKGTYDHAFQSECSSHANTCSGQGAQDGQTAHDQATVATVGFVAGAALLGGGAYLYFSAPASGGVSVGPDVGRSGAGVSVRGAW